MEVKILRRQRNEYRGIFGASLYSIPDEELLDSMVPIRTKRYKRSLVVEDHLRTQGADEPVTDYIVSLLTVLSRFDLPWDPQDQVNLVIDNMLPKLNKKMKIYWERLTNTQELLDKAQEAEDDEDGQWRSQPPAEQSMLPETAYRPANKVAKTRPASVASLDAKLSSLTEEDLEKHFEKFFQKKTLELSSPSRNMSSAGKNSPQNKYSPTRPKQGTGNRNRASTRGGGRGREGKRGKGGWQRGGYRTDAISPKSDKNRDKPAGPDGDKILCWNCS
ncbi:hypothetical protein TSAR_000882 [Trichomalopsis sarcophagae]|uniref:Uncharacterized protein n=1 Tax=Trichomalopsis sarcophagae TaxID=543379 RepID=A0A232EGS2_9HYME|nr:hypothetical protein TSAR_000882 [Trichomalopsis sarcophagae]